MFFKRIGFAVLLAASTKVYAAHEFGLGIVVGSPTGITAKYMLSKTKAIDAAISVFDGGDFYLHGSWLMIGDRLFNISRFPVQWYFGVGARFISDDDHHDGEHGDHVHLGGRFPLGLRMSFNDPRIELFSEVSFAMDVAPETDFDLGLGVGARYYF